MCYLEILDYHFMRLDLIYSLYYFSHDLFIGIHIKVMGNSFDIVFA
jgi:hypothetical protein